VKKIGVLFTMKEVEGVRYIALNGYPDWSATTMTTQTTARRLLTEAEAAAQLTVQTATLRRWRWSGDGPQFIKVGRLVRYDPDVLGAFVDAGRRSSTSAQGPGQT